MKYNNNMGCEKKLKESIELRDSCIFVYFIFIHSSALNTRNSEFYTFFEFFSHNPYYYYMLCFVLSTFMVILWTTYINTWKYEKLFSN